MNTQTNINANAFLEQEGLGSLMRKYAVFPLTVVALAVAVMIGDGCYVFVSICLGARNEERAHKSIGNSIVLCIVSSLILTAVYFLFQNQILTAFGGNVNEETYFYSKEYFTYISMGIPFYMFGQTQYAQIPMAVVGIVMKFFQIVISVVVGMAAGCIPIVGYNIGAGRKDRAKNLFTLLLISEACVGIIAFLIVEFLPRQLIAIFGAANESVYYTDFAIRAFRIYLCMIIPACVNKAAFIYMQSLGSPQADKKKAASYD